MVISMVGITNPDIETLDALAGLQLLARRHGRSLCLSDTTPTLRELIALAGLSDTLPCREDLLPEAEGQPEERKEACRVKEEGDAADASV